MNPNTRLKILDSFKSTSNMRLTSEQCDVPFNTVCKVISDERRTRKLMKAKGQKLEPIAESLHVSALRLFKEFSCIMTVAILLDVKYHKITNILDQEKANQKVAKHLSELPVPEWPNKYAESQSRHAKYQRRKKALKKEQVQKQVGITFGHGATGLFKDKRLRKVKTGTP